MRLSHAVAREEPRADMTPMIDVVFQLLIFFLCTLHFRQLEGKLDAFLPRDAGAAPTASRLDPLELRLVVVAPGERRDPLDPSRPWSGSGSWELSGRRLCYVLGPRRFEALDGLGRRLEELYRSDPERALALDAGPGTLQGDVVSVLDRILDAGFRDVRISGRASTPP